MRMSEKEVVLSCRHCGTAPLAGDRDEEGNVCVLFCSTCGWSAHGVEACHHHITTRLCMDAVAWMNS
jgi:hypothetical protein